MAWRVGYAGRRRPSAVRFVDMADDRSIGLSVPTAARGRGPVAPNGVAEPCDRPAEAADRAVPGHWEGDLLTGGPSSYVATLVERQSRYVVLVRLPSNETHTVVRALTQRVQ